LIENEVNKLIKEDFIREVKYPTCISSIVPLRKKNGQIRVCVDFRDLNNACPKDEFPLPIPESMNDSTTSYEGNVVHGWFFPGIIKFAWHQIMKNSLLFTHLRVFVATK